MWLEPELEVVEDALLDEADEELLDEELLDEVDVEELLELVLDSGPVFPGPPQAERTKGRNKAVVRLTASGN